MMQAAAVILSVMTVIVSVVSGSGESVGEVKAHTSRSFLSVGRRAVDVQKNPVQNGLANISKQMGDDIHDSTVNRASDGLAKTCAFFRVLGEQRREEATKARGALDRTKVAIAARLGVLKQFNDNTAVPALDAGNKHSSSLKGASVAKEIVRRLKVAQNSSNNDLSLTLEDLENLNQYLAKLSQDLTTPLSAAVDAALKAIDDTVNTIPELFANTERLPGIQTKCLATTKIDPQTMQIARSQSLQPAKGEMATHDGRKLLDGHVMESQIVALTKHLNNLLLRTQLHDDIIIENALIKNLDTLHSTLVQQAKALMTHALELDANTIMTLVTNDAYFDKNVLNDRDFIDDRRFLKAAHELLTEVANRDYSTQPGSLTQDAGRVMSLKLTAAAPIEFGSVFNVQPSPKSPANGHLENTLRTVSPYPK